MAALIDPTPVTVEVTTGQNNPIEVEVVRRDKTFKDVLEVLTVAVFTTVVNAWIIMLLIPVAFDTVSFGYWKVVALYLAVRVLLPSGDHEMWTRKFTPSGRKP